MWATTRGMNHAAELSNIRPAGDQNHPRQVQPYSVLQQVALIYIGTRTDYLERIPTIQVQDVKHQLLERFNDRCALASTAPGLT